MKHCQKNKAEESSSLQKTSMWLEPPALERDKLYKLASKIDDALQSTVKRTHASFCELSAF